MKRPILLSAAVTALALAAGVASAKTLPASEASPAFAGHRLASEARITLAQAKLIALKARPGVFTDEELEREGGGSGLRYSFDVRRGRATYEVGVDARTGKVLEVSREGRRPD